MEGRTRLMSKQRCFARDNKFTESSQIQINWINIIHKFVQLSAIVANVRLGQCGCLDVIDNIFHKNCKFKENLLCCNGKVEVKYFNQLLRRTAAMSETKTTSVTAHLRHNFRIYELCTRKLCSYAALFIHNHSHVGVLFAGLHSNRKRER